MSNPNTNLFNQLFVDYVQSIFFKHPETRFTVDTMTENMPLFYRESSMVNAAIHILLMQERIIEDKTKDINNPEFHAKLEAIKSVKEIEEAEKKIKLITKQNVASQRVPLKFWWLISPGTIVLSVMGSFFMNKCSKPISTTIFRTEQPQQSTQDTQHTQLRIDTLHLQDSLQHRNHARF